MRSTIWIHALWVSTLPGRPKAPLAGIFALLLLGALSPFPACAGASLLTNGGMEAGMAAMPDGWEPLWTRDLNAGTAGTDAAAAHSGGRSLRVDYRGTQDWSVAQSKLLAVKPGDILALSGWVKYAGTGSAEISVAVRGSDGTVLDWQAGLAQVTGTQSWTPLKRFVVIPPGGATVQFRFTGNGPGTVWLDDAALEQSGSAGEFSRRLQGKTLHLSSQVLDVRLDAARGTFSVTDKRCGQVWRQGALDPEWIVKDAVPLSASALRLLLWDAADNLPVQATVTLLPNRPELRVRLTADGPVQGPLAFPAPFVTAAKTWLVVPMNEGILFPVGDASLPPITLTTYSGHGLCMPWFGVIDPRTGTGIQTILQTPDDAHVDFTRQPGGGLYAQPAWEPSRGEFASPRTLTYVFSAQGGYVAQAKRYRTYAQAAGLFKTLAQKQRKVPAVDKLIGAVDVWNWDMDPVTLCREMKSLGLDHVLWSRGGSPQQVAGINALGYLTSRYDIYQDVYPPDSPSWMNRAGWPDDLVRLPNGDFLKGWADREKTADGTEIVYQGGVINSQRGLARAMQAIPADLKTTPYRCRFIDTTTASPWREDYAPAHPLSRSQDRRTKMALLAFCAGRMKQVVGTETGIDPAVPYADYFEGMLSLGPYRLPDAGYTMMAYKTPTPDFLKFQIGHFYRVPLWELVYHDCVVADWYWGDSASKDPEFWTQRDLFNLLYSTPPLFLFDQATWQKNKARFVQTYKTVCPVARRLGKTEMISHEFLTPDHAVQRTRWADGTTVTVNFGTTPYRLGGGSIVPPLGSVVH